MQVLNDNILVFGDPLADAVKQITTVRDAGAYGAALMADHHVGYSMPIGGVAAYIDQVSPSGVGYDIACGNAAVRLNLKIYHLSLGQIKEIADEIASTISFGIGRVNKDNSAVDVRPDLWTHPAWDIPEIGALKELAMNQLGTVGAGNHYVDVLVDIDGNLWVANHFGSRGLGHKIATHFIKQAGGKDGMFVEPVVFSTLSDIGKEYLAAMDLAGKYAYAGRDWVIGKVVDLFGSSTVTDYVHNHHNYAWNEHHFQEDMWVVRKGATPLHPGQRGFIGGSMGDISVVVKGRVLQGVEGLCAFYSAPHGAGRVMSRTQAAGKIKFKQGRKERVSEGAISKEMMMDAIGKMSVTLRGGYMDEAPQVYKNLGAVLDAHHTTLEVEHVLTPVIVVMAPQEINDPYKD
jgi:tRNA-splicing ligase RtcB (3'-phosphate/5'-hydroxy nucleic acid ligase)